MRKPIVANLCLLSAAVVFALALGQDTARSRAGILFELHFVEGLCPGNCRTETLIRKDGTLTSTHYAIDESTATETSPGVISVSWRGEVLGTATVARADVVALTAQIEHADFAQIRSKSRKQYRGAGASSASASAACLGPGDKRPGTGPAQYLAASCSRI